jgi:hypothetical protein
MRLGQQCQLQPTPWDVSGLAFATKTPSLEPCSLELSHRRAV